MAEARAAIRYAKAVLELAKNQNITEIVNDDMKLIANSIAKSKDLSDMLQSPVLKSSEKKSALLEVFKNTNKITENLIDILISNKRLSILVDVASKYNLMFDQLKGTEIAEVITAVPLTDALKTKVLIKVKELIGKDVEIKNVIDKAILGGFILRVGDIQYNASIANKLYKLKKEFTLN